MLNTSERDLRNEDMGVRDKKVHSFLLLSSGRRLEIRERGVSCARLRIDRESAHPFCAVPSKRDVRRDDCRLRCSIRLSSRAEKGGKARSAGNRNGVARNYLRACSTFRALARECAVRRQARLIIFLTLAN